MNSSLNFSTEELSVTKKSRGRGVLGCSLLVVFCVFAVLIGALFKDDTADLAEPRRRLAIWDKLGPKTGLAGAPRNWLNSMGRNFFGLGESGNRQDSLTAHRASILHFVNSPIENDDDDNSAEYFPDGLLVLSSDGRVEMVGAYDEVREACDEKGLRLEILDQRPNLIMPGFIDAHVHYSQETLTGAFSTSLLPWLNDYVYPTESLFGRSCGFPFDSFDGPTPESCAAERLDYARYMSKQFA